MVPPTVRATLDALAEDDLVLDVGGWAQPDERADWVIDIGSYDTRNYYAHRLGSAAPTAPERFTRDTWVERDICATDPWPFDDDMFAYAICSHTLEDIRDPIRVCEEMSRVARAGYVETPNASIEVTRGIQSRRWCGWSHHRWLVRLETGGLVFFAKPHHIHDSGWPSIRSPRLVKDRARAPVSLEWTGTLPAREDVQVDAEDVDRYLLALVAESARADPVGAATRRVHRAAGRAAEGGRAVARALRR